MTDYAKKSDETLVTLVITNNRDLYALLIRRYQAKLLRYATLLVNGDKERAQDIVQEAFINAYEHLRGFDTRKKFSSWLYRIVHNLAINDLKKHQREQSLPEHFELASDSDLEDDFIKSKLIQDTHACLSQMPVLYKEALSLYYLDEKSYEEISDILRIPMGTVATRISRAKGILKNICQKNQ